MQLSPHFTMAELTNSPAATRLGIDNAPPSAVAGNLARVAATLEQIRALVGGPITVSSGYRSPALNKAVGGAANSAHVLGLAADITAPGMTARALALLIRDSGIALDQCILEFERWVHIGLSASAYRREFLTAKIENGSTRYLNGIV